MVRFENRFETMFPKSAGQTDIRTLRHTLRHTNINAHYRFIKIEYVVNYSVTFIRITLRYKINQNTSYKDNILDKTSNKYNNY